MKRFITYLLLGAMALLSPHGLFSCRSLKKNRQKADSTATRIENRAASWTNETVTEMIIEPSGQTALLPTGLDYPGIFSPATVGHSDAYQPAASPLIMAGDRLSAEQAARGRVTIRQTQRSQGRLSSQKLEDKAVTTSQNTKGKERSISAQVLVGISVIAIGLLAFILYHLKKRH